MTRFGRWWNCRWWASTVAGTVGSTTLWPRAGSMSSGCGGPWPRCLCRGRRTVGWCWPPTSPAGFSPTRTPHRSGSCATPTDGGKDRHIPVPGWPYSVICALETGRSSWTAPLDALRLAPGAGRRCRHRHRLAAPRDPRSREGHQDGPPTDCWNRVFNCPSPAAAPSSNSPSSIRRPGPSAFSGLLPPPEACETRFEGWPRGGVRAWCRGAD